MSSCKCHWTALSREIFLPEKQEFMSDELDDCTTMTLLNFCPELQFCSFVLFYSSTLIKTPHWKSVCRFCFVTFKHRSLWTCKLPSPSPLAWQTASPDGLAEMSPMWETRRRPCVFVCTQSGRISLTDGGEQVPTDPDPSFTVTWQTRKLRRVCFISRFPPVSHRRGETGECDCYWDEKKINWGQKTFILNLVFS